MINPIQIEKKTTKIQIRDQIVKSKKDVIVARYEHLTENL